jgi:segregation and condensation protein A
MVSGSGKDKKRQQASADSSGANVPQGDGVQSDFIVDEATDKALRLQLDRFEGPLDVLLHLITVQEIDIFDIPIVRITEQYLKFLDLLQEENLDVAGDFLVMAATLIQIKSRMLLPPDLEEEEEDDMEQEDPRLELVEKLLEYRKYRDLTRIFQKLEEARENFYHRSIKPVFEPEDDGEELMEVTLHDLVQAFRGVIRFFWDDLLHTVQGEGYSVDEKIVEIEESLVYTKSVTWFELLAKSHDRVEVICYFLAILELCRMNRIRVYQSDVFGDMRLFETETKDKEPLPA